jgi:hypothetical protein
MVRKKKRYCKCGELTESFMKPCPHCGYTYYEDIIGTIGIFLIGTLVLVLMGEKNLFGAWVAIICIFLTVATFWKING